MCTMEYTVVCVYMHMYYGMCVCMCVIVFERESKLLLVFVNSCGLY